VAYDLFISYASEDKTIADAVCARLESAGIRCWIAPRDITAGKSYGEAIIEAIREVKAMVLVFSSSANASVHIPKEVERAVSKGVPIIPFRIEDVAAGKSLDYFIGSVHWLDAMTPPMEKHLDDLATTIHKLFPVQAGEQGAHVTQSAGVWQRSAPPAAPVAAPVAAVRPAPSGEAARASSSSSKTIWIGVAVVAVLAVVVLGAMLLRGGGNSHNAAIVPGASNPASNPVPPSAPNPTPVAPSAPAPAPAVNAGTDPIVGCYQWFNNGQVVIHANGTAVGGPFNAHWRLVSASSRTYTITWPEAVDTVTISANQQSLSGGNQYGYPTSGTRVVGSGGLSGIWRWANNVPVTVYPNGTFSAATFNGKWQTVDASRGIYTLTWPNPVDNLTLSADGSRLSGADQYGVAISGVKTGPCGI
jgi:hypothetical protein